MLLLVAFGCFLLCFATFLLLCAASCCIFAALVVFSVPVAVVVAVFVAVVVPVAVMAMAVAVTVAVPVPVAVGQFLRVVIAGGERSERAKRASEALWCLLWVSLAYPCFRWRTLAFSCVACSTMVCLLSLLSLALPCVTYFNSPKTISLLLLHASTTLICLRASRSLLRQVFLCF